VCSDLAKNDLNPAATVFVPLPSCSFHYFVAKVTPLGIIFELLKLVRVPADNGVGMKLGIGDRSPLDLGKLRGRRQDKGVKGSTHAQSRGEVTEAEGADEGGTLKGGRESSGGVYKQDQGADSGQRLTAPASTFQIEKKDLKDLFIFCK
jgi:hypothetical protein